MKKFQRKILIFIFAVFAVLFAAYTFSWLNMPEVYFKEYVYFVISMGIGFFAGNSAEHMAKAIMKNRGGNDGKEKAGSGHYKD